MKPERDRVSGETIIGGRRSEPPTRKGQGLLNRRIRTRMYGGVGGVGCEVSSYYDDNNNPRDGLRVVVCAVLVVCLPFGPGRCISGPLFLGRKIFEVEDLPDLDNVSFFGRAVLHE